MCVKVNSRVIYSFLHLLGQVEVEKIPDLGNKLSWGGVMGYTPLIVPGY